MPGINRRHLLLGGAAAGLTLGAVACATRVEGGTSIKSAAARSGRIFGAAVRDDQLTFEGDLRSAVLHDCSALTPEISLKWGAIEPERGKYTYQRMDGLRRFARRRDMILHGHTLLWHGDTPRWVAHALEETRDWNIVSRHFASTLGRYRDDIPTWDVVNEPIETGQRMDGLRQTPFMNAFGPNYIQMALFEAHEHAPNAKLYVNEFGVDYDIPVERDRRYLFLKQIEKVRKAGAPLHGVGIQGHLDLEKGPFTDRVFAKFLRDVADFDVDIQISELDVREHDYAAPVEVRDRRVAEHVKRYLDVALDQPRVIGVTTWGMSARHSWLQVEPQDLQRYWQLRSKAAEGPGFNRGLPYDGKMRPVMMREAILAAFEGRPLTR